MFNLKKDLLQFLPTLKDGVSLQGLYEKEYCREISCDAGNVVFGTRANAVNFLLNLMLERIETIIKNLNNDITRYDNRIIETNGKLNAWNKVD